MWHLAWRRKNKMLQKYSQTSLCVSGLIFRHFLKESDHLIVTFPSTFNLVYLHKYIEILCTKLQSSFPFPVLQIKVFCSLVVQEGVAFLLLARVNKWSLAGRGEWGDAVLAHLFSRGKNWAALPAIQTQMCADLRWPKALHLASCTHLIQLHWGFLVHSQQ